MICRNCGNNISDTSRFCTYCGCNVEPVAQGYPASGNRGVSTSRVKGGLPKAVIIPIAGVSTAAFVVAGVALAKFVIFNDNGNSSVAYESDDDDDDDKSEKSAKKKDDSEEKQDVQSETAQEIESTQVQEDSNHGPDIESQVDCIYANYSIWNMPDELYADSTTMDYINYYITDLDQDGLLEITASLMQGTGIFTSSAVFEVTENVDGLTQIKQQYNPDYGYDDYSVDGFIDFNVATATDIETYDGYYDPDTGRYYYITYDFERSGYQYYGTVYYKTYMVDNQIYSEKIGVDSSYVDDSGKTTTTYYINSDTYPSEDALFLAIKENLGDMRQTRYSLLAFMRSDVTGDDMLRDKLLESAYAFNMEVSR